MYKISSIGMNLPSIILMNSAFCAQSQESKYNLAWKCQKRQATRMNWEELLP